jgi:hypothetical protein
VNKQLSGWIEEEVKSRLKSLSPLPVALTIEQIQEVVQQEQLNENTFLQRVQQEKREKQFQKEKENF